MKADFTIGELEHIRYTVSKTPTVNIHTAISISNKIEGILEPFLQEEANHNTQLGSPRKPASIVARKKLN
jgi:hypothetical protein